MSDGYAGAILDAIGKASTQNVWSGTDALSTVYRGKRAHVLDAVEACFASANDGRTHVTMEATFSRGCPGDSGGDFLLAADDAPLNPRGKKFDILSKISLYPLGEAGYMDRIARAVGIAKERGVFRRSSHYATELQGDLGDVFDCLGEIMAYAEASAAHYVLQVTLSANSPAVTNRAVANPAATDPAVAGPAASKEERDGGK